MTNFLIRNLSVFAEVLNFSRFKPLRVETTNHANSYSGLSMYIHVQLKAEMEETREGVTHPWNLQS